MADFSPSTYGALLGLIMDTLAGGGALQGRPGDDGREIELSSDDTYIRWRYVGEAAWINLVSLSDLGQSDMDINDLLVLGDTEPDHEKTILWLPLIK